MGDVSKLQPIANRIFHRDSELDLTKLSDRDQIFFLVWSYAAELDNGGHAQFFFNHSGEHSKETVIALKKLALDDLAELLEAAAELLFRSNVPSDIEERNDIMCDLPDSVDESLEELDHRYFGARGGNRVLDRLEEWYFAQAD